MAIIVQCDLCGERVDGEPNERGVMRKRQYCDGCIPKIDDFILARDGMHTEFVKEWQARYRELYSPLAIEDRLPD